MRRFPWHYACPRSRPSSPPHASCASRLTTPAAHCTIWTSVFSIRTYAPAFALPPELTLPHRRAARGTHCNLSPPRRVPQPRLKHVSHSFTLYAPSGHSCAFRRLYEPSSSHLCNFFQRIHSACASSTFSTTPPAAQALHPDLCWCFVVAATCW